MLLSDGHGLLNVLFFSYTSEGVGWALLISPVDGVQFRVSPLISPLHRDFLGNSSLSCPVWSHRSTTIGMLAHPRSGCRSVLCTFLGSSPSGASRGKEQEERDQPEIGAVFFVIPILGTAGKGASCQAGTRGRETRFCFQRTCSFHRLQHGRRLLPSICIGAHAHPYGSL